MNLQILFSIFFLFLFVLSPSLSASSSVLSAQQILSRLGYYNGPMDGSMGSGTSAAIRRFQVANHLRPTGILTPQTDEALGISAPTEKRKGNFKAPRSPVQSTVETDPKALADLFVGGPLLAASPEIQVATIQRAQQNLKTLGYYEGPINGLPDASFKAALLTYQRDSKFKRSGRLDKITLMGLDILPGVYQSGH